MAVGTQQVIQSHYTNTTVAYMYMYIHAHILTLFAMHVQAAIHIADPLCLTACSLLSAHGYSSIIGLDVLTPGSDHVVVRTSGVCVCGEGGKNSHMHADTNIPLAVLDVCTVMVSRPGSRESHIVCHPHLHCV